MYYLNHSNRPVRTRMPGGVGGAQLIMAAPYPDGIRFSVFRAPLAAAGKIPITHKLKADQSEGAALFLDSCHGTTSKRGSAPDVHTDRPTSGG